jgi:hypothetical protein
LLERKGDIRYNDRMARFRSVLRIALLALFAAASLNGIMVFLFFDGTNFYGHLDAWQAKEEMERNAGSISGLVRRIEETRTEGNLACQRMEKSLRKEYAHLDSVIRSADILLRHPLRKRDLEAIFRADHPFRVENGKLAIYIRNECIYTEMLPDYARLQPPVPGSHPRSITALMALGNGPSVIQEFAFALRVKSGPVEIWQAYRRFDDSTYGYYCAYILDKQSKKLVQRGESMDRDIAP